MMIKWNGGKTPEGIKNDTLVQGVYRDGETFEPSQGWAQDVFWEHLDCSPECDIVEYEIIRIN